MKNLNYKIQDWFEHPDFGVIVSIANPELDQLSKNEIKDLVGDCIAILDAETQQERWIQVSQVEVSTSIIDKNNGKDSGIGNQRRSSANSSVSLESVSEKIHNRAFLKTTGLYNAQIVSSILKSLH